MGKREDMKKVIEKMSEEATGKVSPIKKMEELNAEADKKQKELEEALKELGPAP